MGNETLKDTILNGIKEANVKKSETASAETKLSMNATESTKDIDTKEAVKDEKKAEYVAGIDVSDMPENLTKEEASSWLTKKLEYKARLLEKGYQPKLQKVNELAKVDSQLRELGISVQDVIDNIKSNANQNKSASVQKNAEIKELDRLIESAPDAEKSGLINFRKILMQETGIDALLKKIESLEKAVGGYEVEKTSLLLTKSQAELDSLKDVYGNDLVEGYKDEIIEQKRHYPNLDTEKVLMMIVPPNELRDALVDNHSKKIKTRLEEKKSGMTNKPSGARGAEPVDMTGNWKQALQRNSKNIFGFAR